MEQGRWTKTQFANDLKRFVTSSDAGVHSEAEKSAATLFNRLSAIKAASSETSPSARLKSGNETLECGVGKGVEIGADSSNAGGSSSYYIRWLILAAGTFMFID